jgi:hypothetical protein
MRQLIVGNGSVPTGGTYYTGLTGGGNDWITDEDQCRIPVPVAGTLRHLRITVTTAAGVGDHHAFALLVNGVASALTVTISNTDTEGSNTGTDVSVAAGDYVALRRVNTTFDAAGWVHWSLEFEGATGESWYGVWGGQLAGGGPFYLAPFGALGGASPVPKSLVAVAGTLTRYDVRVRVAPGAGKTHDVVLSKNGVTQNGSGGTPDTRLSLTGASTLTGSLSGFNLTVAPGDLLQYVCTQTGGAATTHVSIGTKLVADVDGTSQLTGISLSSVIPNGATNWTPFAYAHWTTTEAAAQLALDGAYWASALYAYADAPGAGTSYTFTLRKNGATPATTPTVTISGATSPATGSDTDPTHVVGFVATDTIALQSVPAGTPARVQTFVALAIHDTDPSEPVEPPGNTIIVWIDDIDRTSLVSALRWSSTINGIGTATFTVKDPTGAYIPQDDQVVEIEVAGTIRWAGTIANPAGTSHLVHRGEGTFCQVTCQDYNQQLQRALSNTIIPPQSLRDTLVYLCDGTLVPMGITLDPTQDEGPTLTTITSPWLTTEQFVDYLATQTGWVRRVDQDSQLKMWAVGSVASGVTLSAANANVRAAAYDLQRFDYRSAQWVVFGPNGVLHVADAWTGDGVTQVFPQHYQNFPTRPATVTVGATTYPVGIYGVDAFEWTWSEVYPPTLVHTGTAVGVGVLISTDYDALFPTWVYVEGDEFGARPWTRVDFAPHILDWQEATAYAEALIRQHQPRLKLPQVTTYVETIAVGSTVVVDFPVLGIDALTCFVRATETVVIPTGAEVLLETTLDLIGGTEDVPANSATDLWKRIIFGEQASSGSSGAVGSTSGGLSPATSANAHTLLSTAHSDVVAATVVRGDVLVANSTPAWARVARGAAGTMLRSDGTDVSWSTDGSALTGITATAAAHNLLSASHGDALAASVVRGDLLIGNSTPKWARLAIGAANQVLWSNGTDPLYTGAPVLSTSLTVPAILSSGALSLTAATGSPLTVNLGGAGDFLVNTTQLVVDTSSGNVGIGMFPATTVDVTSALALPALRFQNTNTSGGFGAKILSEGTDAARYVLYCGNLAESTHYFIVKTATGAVGYVGIGTNAPSAQLHTTGSVRHAAFGAGTATFDASGNLSSVSDARLKDRIAPLPYGLAAVQQLRPVLFGYTDDSGLERDHLYGGFLAQDVQAVMPHAVGQDAQGYLTLADRPILGAVVQAVQTLAARVEALEAERHGRWPIR